jgi:hypothetical protein
VLNPDSVELPVLCPLDKGSSSRNVLNVVVLEGVIVKSCIGGGRVEDKAEGREAEKDGREKGE